MPTPVQTLNSDCEMDEIEEVVVDGASIGTGKNNDQIEECKDLNDTKNSDVNNESVVDNNANAENNKNEDHNANAENNKNEDHNANAENNKNEDNNANAENNKNDQNDTEESGNGGSLSKLV